ncbi:MAG: FHA domain-containing protein [Oscillatoriaceae bacterium SKW80]|nr:FHA domain-containing protein [Oscillatoriaceae bacterium SKYG93]MCX8120930.1 FHA domain-containing protein [Oscillatoriaceae bacterium SKW80]MDW8452203.1 FHA domain-containing protein [Oscillatoriaceae cyanobacterium SKYGB_i_bin93]HIK26539.1 FHA domain-containing protein [Oscillatoriaceae cyanobacterium M7585_C2015_266]
MSTTTAKLVIYKNKSETGEFPLNGDEIKIGRAPDNAIILNEPAVSRYHAHIIRTRNGYAIADLGSSGGTRVNGKLLPPPTPYPLKEGDVITISIFELRFHSSTLPATALMLPESSPVLEVKTPSRIQKFPLNRDVLILGRAPNCDILIEAPVVSARHAELRRTEAGWEIIDKGSTNGLSFAGKRIPQKILQNGDVLYIGSDISLTYRATPLSFVNAPAAILSLRDRSCLTLGRDPKNDEVINHPAVSRFHARIYKRSDGSWAIADLNSTNGTFVGGKQVIGERVLLSGDHIRIAPCSLIFQADETLIRQNESGNLRLDAIKLKKEVGKGKNLLQEISLSIQAREFVVIAGVSGGGKSTLLDALNGFRPATSGQVLVNGVDLYKNFNAYRTELGYVPQKDIVHTELTVKEALDYAAQLRMPADTTKAEREKQVLEVMEELGLTQRHDVLVKNLSGGQLKRVSIGVELLTKPSLFFLDEATSGLDPGTESEIMKLLRELANQGRTIILITHATKNVVLCDLVVFLAKGGYVAYIGSPQEAAAYFGVKDFDEIYTKVEHELSPQQWQERYLKSQQYQKYVVERQRSLQYQQPQSGGKNRPAQQAPTARVKRVSAWKQFLILSQRNLTILMRDHASLILMLALAPLLGLLDFVMWKRNIFDIEKGDASQIFTMLFVAVLVAVMVGSLATMREIVKEAEIYRRERAFGLQIFPYILSKLWIGVLLAIYQSAIFLLTKKLAVDIPGGLDVTASLYFTLLLTTIAGMVMGLLVSAISPTQNMAPLLTILFIVPQITFAGAILPLSSLGGVGKFISQLAITRWGYESMVTITGVGQDIAQDPCWQLSEEERKKLTEEEKSARCQCMGSKLFQHCRFPGIKGKYDPAVDEPKPEEPAKPGEMPSFSGNPAELTEFQQQLKEFEEKSDNYQKELEEYRKKLEEWQKNRGGAITAAEALIERFNKNQGGAFNINVPSHWGKLGIIMVTMLGLILGVQKRKDII